MQVWGCRGGGELSSWDLLISETQLSFTGQKQFSRGKEIGFVRSGTVPVSTFFLVGEPGEALKMS